jgi:hypothetical protein
MLPFLETRRPYCRLDGGIALTALWQPGKRVETFRLRPGA